MRAGGLGGEDQEAAERGSCQNSSRLPYHQIGQCGRGGRGCWEEEGKCHKVGKEVGEGDAGGDGVREARREDLEEGPDYVRLGAIGQQNMNQVIYYTLLTVGEGYFESR